MAPIKLVKRRLRAAIAATLATLPQHELMAQAVATEATLRTLPELQKAQKVGVYMSMDTSELKTLPIITALFDMGKRVYLPHCAALGANDLKRFDAQKACLVFYEMPTMQSVLDLKPQGKYGLKEPTSGTNIMEEHTGLDLLLLPAVAYTKECYRMGHGVGFYDDYIKRHVERFGKRPFLLGTGLKEQLVEELPLEPHDEQLDMLVLGSDVYSPTKRP